MHPILFHLGGFPVATYGVLSALGVFLAAMLAMRLGRRAGLDDFATLDVVIVAVLGAVLGGKLLYLVTIFPRFLEDPVGHVFARQGFVFLGGLIGSVALCAWHIQRRQLPFWRVADVFAPAIPLGHAFGRVGCHMTGCCYGGVCAPDAWYGVRYPLTISPDGTVMGGFALLDHLEAGLLPAEATRSLAVFPVQLMEAGALVALSLGLLVLLTRSGGWPGRVFLAYLAGYAVVRLGMETLRGDAARGIVGVGAFALSTSQWLSLGLLAIAAGAWGPGRRLALPTQRREIPAACAWPPRDDAQAEAGEGSEDGRDGSPRGAARPGVASSPAAPSRPERRRAARIKGGSSRR